ncbi:MULTISPECIES: type II toxin-antitoxin system VapC family toxin [unclassified Rhizobium]|uniref:type II toxin-antitoxin system VapC family toxin n=1 Tax=unclassified Rhizobium TaxID=2613769 RepID=UPI001ADB99F4|nr:MULTISPECIES: type II toxin-antitoxin system VapC family toxin [unclassified Rhizobium]MBO9096920.1 type II toxin-antitoxin system VapC family toxin [Rhizobium sp. L58/93]MBO9134239.1 type II toxin-antitoxin system VapC family toxin [Rhizobium sp. B209b/85]MBO9167159.1 type II toxin-antitoxin system VapC family toxin [Rhizobium sp. L245/93]MBO9183117.1 type II toxin-antitoxin system VapC family toxin [Rhizobium sp. E27B/91]QXZ83471.1 type II toxin-antitoxin system VapC family toxin [Rhizobi
MKITADTNVLARAILRDDPAQADTARKLLREATLIAVSVPSLCELVWILRQGAKLPKEDVAAAIRALMDADNVVLNRPAVEAGLALLQAGGDFADGIMAHEGKWLGGETFVSFDKQAVALLSKQGDAVQLLT